MTSLAKVLGLERLDVEKPIYAYETMIHGSERRDYDELDWDCPHCGYQVHLDLLDSAQDDSNSWVTAATGIERDDPDSSDPVERPTLAYLVCRCPRRTCRRVIFVVADKATQKVLDAYPYPNVAASTLPTSIPRAIREDYVEASRCFYARAYKGVVVLCRRVVQDVALNLKEVEKIEVEGDDPAKQIKSLWKLGAHEGHVRDWHAHYSIRRLRRASAG